MANLAELGNKSQFLQYGPLVRGHFNILDPMTQLLGALDRWGGPPKHGLFSFPHHIWPRDWL